MSRLRTFIAVDPGKPIRDRLVALQDNLSRAGSQLKWVEPENLHVTLLFLGEVDDREEPDVCRAVTGCCAAVDAFVMTVGSVGCFGNPRRPRTVWAGLTEGGPEMVALHDALESPLLELGCYRREDRPFAPHITLGRVKGERADERLAAALPKYAQWQSGSVEVEEVLVMSSELRPEGPVYTALSRARLRRSEPRRTSTDHESS
jgi:2'-5' RNA ligase